MIKTLIAFMLCMVPNVCLAGLLADFDQDFSFQNGANGVGIDATGSGSWSYMYSGAPNISQFPDTTLTPLFGRTMGSSQLRADAYLANNLVLAYALPGVSNSALFGTEGQTSTGEGYLHPGPVSMNRMVVARWTSGVDEAGPVVIEGEVSRGQASSIGDGTDFFILRSDATASPASFELIFSQALANTSYGTNYSFSETLNLTAGDQIYLVVDSRGNNTGDGTFLNATISAVPEPGSLAIFLSGSVVGLWCLRRRRMQAAA